MTQTFSMLTTIICSCPQSSMLNHKNLFRSTRIYSFPQTQWQWSQYKITLIFGDHTSCHVLKTLSCETWVKVFFRRQLYSNPSTGLEKTEQGVQNTPPSPIFGSQVPPPRTWWKRSLHLPKKSVFEDWVNYSVTRGFPDEGKTHNSSLEGKQYFHPCFPVSSPVSRPVFPSKSESGPFGPGSPNHPQTMFIIMNQ